LFSQLLTEISYLAGTEREVSAKRRSGGQKIF